MSDTPSSIQKAPKPRGATPLWFVAAIVAGLSAASVPLAYPGKVVPVVVLVVGWPLLAAVGAIMLHRLGAGTSGNGGARRDFLIILCAATTASALLVGVMAIERATARAAVAPAWEQFGHARVADRKSLITALRPLNTSKMLTPTALSRDPGFRSTRRRLAEGRAVIARYRALAQARRREARGTILRIDNPVRRALALRYFEKQMVIRRAGEDRVWDLSAEIYAKADAMVDLLERPGVRIFHDRIQFPSEADAASYAAAEAAHNEVITQRLRQDRANESLGRKRGAP